MWTFTVALVGLLLFVASTIGSSEAFLVVGAASQSNTNKNNNNRQEKTTRLAAVGKTLRRVRDSVTNQERSREDLKLGIAGFYDRSSKLWENVWGERTY